MNTTSSGRKGRIKSRSPKKKRAEASNSPDFPQRNVNQGADQNSPSLITLAKPKESNKDMDRILQFHGGKEVEMQSAAFSPRTQESFRNGNKSNPQFTVDFPLKERAKERQVGLPLLIIQFILIFVAGWILTICQGASSAQHHLVPSL